MIPPEVIRICEIFADPDARKLLEIFLTKKEYEYYDLVQNANDIRPKKVNRLLHTMRKASLVQRVGISSWAITEMASNLIKELRELVKYS